MSKIFIVLGMHRSGTSLLAGLLHKSGIIMGEDRHFIPKPSIENPKGFFENHRFRRINDAILEHNGYVVKNWNPSVPSHLHIPRLLRLRMLILARRYNARYPYWGWKDPRQMLTCEHWFNVLDQLGCLDDVRSIYIFRNPHNTTVSMVRRGNVLTHAHAAELWYSYNKRCLKCIDQFKTDTLFIEMSEFKNSRDNVLKRLSDYVEVEIKRTTFDEFFSASLVRSDADDELENYAPEQHITTLWNQLNARTVG